MEHLLCFRPILSIVYGLTNLILTTLGAAFYRNKLRYVTCSGSLRVNDTGEIGSRVVRLQSLYAATMMNLVHS